MTEKAPVVEPLILTREYTAPREQVFDCWSKAQHLCNWQFPMPGFSIEYSLDDIKAGGSSLHKMTTPKGHEMWLLTEYDEISPPGKLVFRQYDSNSEGEKLSNAHMPHWPRDLVATVMLAEKDGKTSMTFTWEPLNPTEEESAAFSAAIDKLGGGWSGGFENLATYLDTL